MNVPPPVITRNPPALGSFPLDTQGACKELVRKYLDCVRMHDTHSTPCRDLIQMYLKCRMENGLMENSSMESLGFNSNSTNNTM